MEVVWSEEAERMYFKIVDYLFSEWNVVVATRFRDSVSSLIIKLQSFEEMCPPSKILLCHKCSIDKHNSLIYKVMNNTIYVVTLLDNRSSHGY